MRTTWAKRLRPQYSLRSLLALMLCAALLAGLAVHDLAARIDARTKEQASLARVKTRFTHVKYEAQLPFWLRWLKLPDDTETFERVTTLYVWLETQHFGDAQALELRSFSQVRALDLGGTAITDASLPLLGQLEHLEDLSLAGTKISGHDLGPIARLPRLKSLDLGHCRLDRTAWQQLCEMTQLRELCLDDTGLTDAQLAEVCEHLPNLEFLGLDGAFICDERLGPLTHLTQLKEIRTYDCRPGSPSVQSVLPQVQVSACLIRFSDL